MGHLVWGRDGEEGALIDSLRVGATRRRGALFILPYASEMSRGGAYAARVRIWATGVLGWRVLSTHRAITLGVGG